MISSILRPALRTMARTACLLIFLGSLPGHMAHAETSSKVLFLLDAPPNIMGVMPFLAPSPAANTSQQESCLNSFSCPFPVDRPELLTLIKYAATAAPEIARVRAELRSSKADYNRARWAFAPTAAIGMESDINNTTEDFVASLNQPIWTGGRLTSELKQSGANVKASHAAIQIGQFNQAQSLIEYYGNWASAWLKHQAWAEGVREHNDLVALVERRTAGGASGQNELNLALNRRNSVATELITTEASRQLAMARLFQLLGQRPDETAMAAVLAKPYQLIQVTPLVEQKALTHSPFITQAQAQLEGVKAAAKAKRATVYPTVSLRLEHLRENAFGGNSQETTSIAFQLNSNFGAGLSRLAEIRQIDAQVDAAKEAVLITKRGVLEQIQSTAALLNSAERRVIALGQVAQASRQLFVAYQRQFQSGRRSWEDVMNSAREVANHKALLADARATRLTSSWKLALYLVGLEQL